MRVRQHIYALCLLIISGTGFGQVLTNNPCNVGSQPGSQWPLDGNCYNISTAGFTPLFSSGTCNSLAVDDGWMWFVGDGGNITITLNPDAAYDGILHVFEATAPCSVLEVGCSDIGGTNGNETVTLTPSTNGQIYFVRIENYAGNATMTGCVSVTTTGPPPGATYTQPSSGIAGEYVGACLEATCTGTFADNGDLTGNYSNNINAIYRVFCPDAPGMCVSITFNSFAMEGQVNPAGPPPMDCYYDYLTIGNGPTQNSTVLTNAPATATGRICGTPATPFTFTANNPSGCLTVRFTSDNVTTMAGWDATITCTPCAIGPTGTDNSDCNFATGICSNTGNAGNSTGPGIVAEGCNGAACPAGGENHTNWYTFTVQTTGTLAFDIVPQIGSDDYDFAIYGPGVNCGSLGAPVRCSDAGTTGNTGMATGNVDLTESVTGNGYVAPMNVVAGEVYYMVVDEWTPTGAGYSLNFTGTASLDCTVLPIELLDFAAIYVPDEHGVDVTWKTKTELNNDFFTIEKSKDGINYEEFRIVKGAGNSTNDITYISFDPNPYIGMNYYRLKQTDFDGKERYSEVTSVYVENTGSFFIVAPNPAQSNIEVSYNCSSDVPANMIIYDYSGKVIFNQEVECTEGQNRTLVDLSTYPEGIYLIMLTVDGHTLQTKVVKE